MQEHLTTAKPSKTPIITGVIITVIALPVLYTLLLNQPLSVWQSALYILLIHWGLVVFLWWYAMYFESQPLIIWKEKREGIKFILLWTVLLCLLIAVAVFITNVMTRFGYHQNKEILRQISRFMTGRYFLVALITITAGVTEEVIFRGYILTRLSLLFKNQFIPVMLSAAIFSGMHYRYHSAYQFVSTFLVGLIMAIHYKKYGNLKPLIIAHFLVDWLSFTFLHYFVK